MQHHLITFVLLAALCVAALAGQTLSTLRKAKLHDIVARVNVPSDPVCPNYNGVSDPLWPSGDQKAAMIITTEPVYESLGFTATLKNVVLLQGAAFSICTKLLGINDPITPDHICSGTTCTVQGDIFQCDDKLFANPKFSYVKSSVGGCPAVDVTWSFSVTDLDNDPNVEKTYPDVLTTMYTAAWQVGYFMPEPFPQQMNRLYRFFEQEPVITRYEYKKADIEKGIINPTLTGKYYNIDYKVKKAMFSFAVSTHLNDTIINGNIVDPGAAQFMQYGADSWFGGYQYDSISFVEIEGNNIKFPSTFEQCATYCQNAVRDPLTGAFSCDTAQTHKFCTPDYHEWIWQDHGSDVQSIRFCAEFFHAHNYLHFDRHDTGRTDIGGDDVWFVWIANCRSSTTSEIASAVFRYNYTYKGVPYERRIPDSDIDIFTSNDPSKLPTGFDPLILNSGDIFVVGKIRAGVQLPADYHTAMIKIQVWAVPKHSLGENALKLDGYTYIGGTMPDHTPAPLVWPWIVGISIASFMLIGVASVLAVLMVRKYRKGKDEEAVPIVQK
jgi:hypothetical protein